MAKKKDTLKDLNEFMQKQSSDSGSNEDFMSKKPTMLAEVEKLKSEVEQLNSLPDNALHEEQLVELILKISAKANLSPRHILFNISEAILKQQSSKDHIDLLLENNIALLKYHQLLVDKLKG